MTNTSSEQEPIGANLGQTGKETLEILKKIPITSSEEWAKELRELLAEAMSFITASMIVKKSEDDFANGLVEKRDAVIYYVASLLTQAKKEERQKTLEEVMGYAPEKKYIKEFFEANFLDGDKIQGGQMLSSSFCLEAIEYCENNKELPLPPYETN